MVKIGTIHPIDFIKGKFGGTDSGYFYTRNAKQFYRTREENYQQSQSPRQNGILQLSHMHTNNFVP